MMKIKYLDLFSGMGGMRLAIEDACKQLNYLSECVGTYEIKSHAKKQLKYIFNETNIKNILEFDFNDELNFDLLLAGFPCQPFSKAGLGKGFDDNRGNFIFEIIKILKHSHPRFFILENVDNLITHNNGETFNLIINMLKEIGYNIDYKILNLKDFGVPQSRKRLFIIGDYLKPIKIPDNISLNNIQKNTFSSIFDNNILDLELYINSSFNKLIKNKYDSISILQGKSLNDKRGGNNNIHSWDIDLYGKTTLLQKQILNQILNERRKKEYSMELNIPWKDGLPMTIEQINKFLNIPNIKIELNNLVEKKYLKYKKINNNTYGYSILTGRLSFPYSYFINNNGITNTITATEMSKFGVIDLNKNIIRNLSKREGLRLFGYPENYFFDPSLKLANCYDLLGNSLGVPIIVFLAKLILEKIDK